MKLVLFDLDNTLLVGDSDYEWGQFLIENGVVDRGEYEARNQRFYEQYKAGTLDIMQFLGFALAPLAARAIRSASPPAAARSSPPPASTPGCARASSS
jgi:phosphoserine phosphatase